MGGEAILKEQRDRYKAYIFIILLFVLSLTGCVKQQDKTTQADKADVRIEDEQDSGTKRSLPLSETDYAIAREAVGDSGNLYKLRFTLEGEVSFLCFIGSYKDDLIVVYQCGDGTNYIARIDPFTMVTEAQTELPDGMYFDDGVYVTADGQIALCNQMNGEVYFLNGTLGEYDRISLGDAWISYISEDLTRVFYVDNNLNAICVYNRETGEKISLYENSEPENTNGSLIGVYEADNCVLIQEMDMESPDSICRLVRADTGETVQSYTADIRKLEVAEDAYIAYCDVGGLTEIVFGKPDESEPKTLAFADYSEYDYRYVDVENRIAISQTERHVEGKRQAFYNFYCLDTGYRQYELNMPLTENAFVSGYITYIENKSAVLFSTYDECGVTIYVWDLLAGESVSQDTRSYVYKWQGENPADAEEMKRLRARAQEIGARYGVEIYIGNDIWECPTDIYEYAMTDNVVRIDQSLSVLERELARYPDGMLMQLNDGYGSVLRIYLAGQILPIDETAIDTAVGVQNTLPGDTHLVLDINSTYDYESTIHHEIFHAIENYLNMTDMAWIDAEVWDSCNPPDFVYDYDYMENQASFDFTYTANGVEQGEQAYFIDIYSKSFPTEDRARVMEYAMMEEETDTGYFDYEAIRNKLVYISGQIRTGFDTTGWPAVTDWEVWIQ